VSVVSSAVEIYDPTNNTWGTATALPTPRMDLAVAVVNNKIYAIGGWNQTVRSTVEEYDRSSNAWTPKAPMPRARTGLIAIPVNGKIYAIGGSDDANVLPTAEVYDAVTDSWLKSSTVMDDDFNANVLSPTRWTLESPPIAGVQGTVSRPISALRWVCPLGMVGLASSASVRLRATSTCRWTTRF